MPSHQHEVLLLLFHNRPELAAELLREALQVDPPPYAKARIGSAELSEVDPVQYQADLVVILEDEAPVLGIVVEVQLAPDRDKRFVVAGLCHQFASATEMSRVSAGDRH
jgi:hypothetical protein